MTTVSVEAQMAALQAEIAALKAAKASAKKDAPITLKVSEKGAVSVYNLGSRFPTTLYKTQMEKLLDHADVIREFMVKNATSLKTKE